MNGFSTNKNSLMEWVASLECEISFIPCSQVTILFGNLYFMTQRTTKWLKITDDTTKFIYVVKVDIPSL